MQRFPTSSVEVTRNAKGDYQWSVKFYFDGAITDVTDIQALEDDGLLPLESWRALEQAKRLDAALRAHFLPGTVAS
jgi:hypothetical protein